jgi:hypothetical protein
VKETEGSLSFQKGCSAKCNVNFWVWPIVFPTLSGSRGITEARVDSFVVQNYNKRLFPGVIFQKDYSRFLQEQKMPEGISAFDLINL